MCQLNRSNPIVARTDGYTYAAKFWALSLVQVPFLSPLIVRISTLVHSLPTSPFFRQTIQVKWLTCLILKHMQLGIGEKEILSHLHQDAVDRYNVTCDLREVCAAVRDRRTRLTRQDIKVSGAGGLTREEENNP